MSLKDWIAPKRTALLLIDMQKDFLSPAIEPAVKNAEALANTARQAGVPCIFIRLIANAKDEFLKEWESRRGENGLPLCREGTPGAEFIGPRPLSGELVFSKKRYNAFANTNLDSELRALGVDTLVVAGLTTECCIDSTVREAFERSYHVFVAEDATDCHEPGLHAAALRAMALNCAMIVKAEDVRAAWKT